MAESFYKSLDSGKDIVSTRTLLHEAIPLTGTIVYGTYSEANIKNYAHGMFQSVYDYPYLSSSANHIFDITVGVGASSGLYSTVANQKAKKLNIYNQMAQVLMGYDHTGSILRFDEDGDILGGGDKIDNVLFYNFSRLIVKDEIKKGTFSLKLGVGAEYTNPYSSIINITDASGSNAYLVNSPVGEYGILYAKNDTGTPLTNNNSRCGLLFYQAGVAALNDSIFGGASAQASTALATDNGTQSHGFVTSDHITIISTDGTKKIYVMGGDGGSPATGTVVATGDTIATATTLPSSIGNLGTCVVVKIHTLTQASQVINEICNAIEAAGGHNAGSTDSKIDVSTALTPAGSAQSRTLTQNDGTAANRHLGNTVVTVSSGWPATVTIANFSGGGSGGILATSIGAPKITSVDRLNSLTSNLTGSNIETIADGLRNRMVNLQFNNTVELNSTVYFCRVNHNEYNYSTNPTYLTGSKIRVKTQSSDLPVSYITTVGLYNDNNELLGVAKVSEPLKKTPDTELTLRVRLDY
tara:strand:- start:4439 stop:6013 length:1575 start_codon:yes stop_codon:yes gene_type:complete